jgi:TPR repeat protein
VPLIAKGRSVELPLYADFSPDILRFTDDGRILGEVVIRYRFLGTERQSAQTVSVQVHNRNLFPQADPSTLAAFVSPASPEILEYSKHVTGLERSVRRTGLNQNMQAALWLFEGLRAAGIRFDDTHTGEAEVQFPAETLGYMTGTRTDLGLLYAAALEASGIPSAIIPLNAGSAGAEPPGDFIVACYLGVSQGQAELLYNGLERVLVIDGGVWMPLSMNAFNEGFTLAWHSAVESLNKLFTDGVEADFIMLESAWGIYPPAPLPAQGGTAVRISEEDLTRTADGVIRQYIAQEIQPLVEALQRQIAANPTAALYNRLGILLVRSGRSAEARAAYERAAGMGLVPAMTNRGNLALIERDYAAAERWFRQALTREPENQTALRGMEKIEERRE